MSPTKKVKKAPIEEIIPVAPIEPTLPDAAIVPPPPELVLTPTAAMLNKPGKVQTIAILTLISGISNIIWMISLAIGLIIFGIITWGVGFLFGCLIVPLFIPPLVLGVFEIVYAAKLLANPPTIKTPSQTIAILEIVSFLTGNVIPLVAGILALVFYNDEEVKQYLLQVNTPA